MIISVVELLVRCLLSCLTVLTRHEVSMDARAVGAPARERVLRHHVGRVHYEPGDRVRRAELSRLVPRRRWGEVFAVTPAILLGWRRRGWSHASGNYMSRRHPGRPSMAAAIRQLVIRIATDNPA